MPRHVVSQLRFEKRIGVGSRGQVFQANSGDGKIVAVKVMNREDDETNVEITAISRLQPHPHIIAMLGSVEYSADSAFLVLEFCETDLLEVVTARGGEGLPEDVASAYFLQLVKALRHSHKRGVYHGDIKPENCLIQGADLKLCDFGSASLQRMSTRATGSVLYAAPEVVPYLAEHSDASPLAPGAHEAAATLKAAGMLGVHDVVRYDAAAADCWSLGVVLFVMLAGRPPFAEATLYDAEFVKLVQNEFDFPPHFSNDAVRLLRFILRVPPAERPTISDILRDPWVTPFSEARASINVMQRRMTRQHHGGDRLHGSRHHRRSREHAGRRVRRVSHGTQGSSSNGDPSGMITDSASDAEQSARRADHTPGQTTVLRGAALDAEHDATAWVNDAGELAAASDEEMHAVQQLSQLELADDTRPPAHAAAMKATPATFQSPYARSGVHASDVTDVCLPQDGIPTSLSMSQLEDAAAADGRTSVTSGMSVSPLSNTVGSGLMATHSSPSLCSPPGLSLRLNSGGLQAASDPLRGKLSIKLPSASPQGGMPPQQQQQRTNTSASVSSGTPGARMFSSPASGKSTTSVPRSSPAVEAVRAAIMQPTPTLQRQGSAPALALRLRGTPPAASVSSTRISPASLARSGGGSSFVADSASGGMDDDARSQSVSPAGSESDALVEERSFHHKGARQRSLSDEVVLLNAVSKSGLTPMSAGSDSTSADLTAATGAPPALRRMSMSSSSRGGGSRGGGGGGSSGTPPATSAPTGLRLTAPSLDAAPRMTLHLNVPPPSVGSSNATGTASVDSGAGSAPLGPEGASLTRLKSTPSAVHHSHGSGSSFLIPTRSAAILAFQLRQAKLNSTPGSAVVTPAQAATPARPPTILRAPNSPVDEEMHGEPSGGDSSTVFSPAQPYVPTPAASSLTTPPPASLSTAVGVGVGETPASSASNTPFGLRLQTPSPAVPGPTPPTSASSHMALPMLSLSMLRDGGDAASGAPGPLSTARKPASLDARRSSALAATPSSNSNSVAAAQSQMLTTPSARLLPPPGLLSPLGVGSPAGSTSGGGGGGGGGGLGLSLRIRVPGGADAGNNALSGVLPSRFSDSSGVFAAAMGMTPVVETSFASAPAALADDSSDDAMEGAVQSADTEHMPASAPPARVPSGHAVNDADSGSAAASSVPSATTRSYRSMHALSAIPRHLQLSPAQSVSSARSGGVPSRHAHLPSTTLADMAVLNAGLWEESDVASTRSAPTVANSVEGGEGACAVQEPVSSTAAASACSSTTSAASETSAPSALSIPMRRDASLSLSSADSPLSATVPAPMAAAIHVSTPTLAPPPLRVRAGSMATDTRALSSAASASASGALVPAGLSALSTTSAAGSSVPALPSIVGAASSTSAASAAHAGPSHPTAEALHRVRTSVRQAVETRQAAHGITEGFQLSNVHLLRGARVRRRLVPAATAGTLTLDALTAQGADEDALSGALSGGSAGVGPLSGGWPRVGMPGAAAPTTGFSTRTGLGVRGVYAGGEGASDTEPDMFAHAGAGGPAPRRRASRDTYDAESVTSDAISEYYYASDGESVSSRGLDSDSDAGDLTHWRFPSEAPADHASARSGDVSDASSVGSGSSVSGQRKGRKKAGGLFDGVSLQQHSVLFGGDDDTFHGSGFYASDDVWGNNSLSSHSHSQGADRSSVCSDNSHASSLFAASDDAHLASAFSVGGHAGPLLAAERPVSRTSSQRALLPPISSADTGASLGLSQSAEDVLSSSGYSSASASSVSSVGQKRVRARRPDRGGSARRSGSSPSSNSTSSSRSPVHTSFFDAPNFPSRIVLPPISSRHSAAASDGSLGMLSARDSDVLPGELGEDEGVMWPRSTSGGFGVSALGLSAHAPSGGGPLPPGAAWLQPEARAPGGGGFLSADAAVSGFAPGTQAAASSGWRLHARIEPRPRNSFYGHSGRAASDDDESASDRSPLPLRPRLRRNPHGVPSTSPPLERDVNMQRPPASIHGTADAAAQDEYSPRLYS